MKPTMSDVSLKLTTGSGASFGFSGPDPVTNYYAPLDIYYNGMLKVGPTTWHEIHPDGYRHIYDLVPRSRRYVRCIGTPSSSSSSSSSAGPNPCAPVDLGIQRSL